MAVSLANPAEGSFASHDIPMLPALDRSETGVNIGI